jgi:hypothetical protein
MEHLIGLCSDWKIVIGTLLRTVRQVQQPATQYNVKRPLTDAFRSLFFKVYLHNKIVSC